MIELIQLIASTASEIAEEKKKQRVTRPMVEQALTVMTIFKCY